MKYTKEIKVGLFAILGVTLLVLGYNFLKGFNPLQGYNKYYVVYNNVSGIVKSSQVTINGLKVGQVEAIGMLTEGDPNHLLVTVIVEKSIKLPKGTTATISSQGLLGSTDIVIAPVPDNGTILGNKDTLVAGYEESITTSIQKIVTPLKEKSVQVLATLDKVLLSMNEVFDSSGTQKLSNGINDFSGTLHNMRNITGRFDQLTAEEYDKLKGMIVNMEAITRNLKNNNESINKALKNVSRITDSVAASDLTATINHTRDVMKEFSTTLDKVNKGHGSLGKMANDDSLYNNINRTSSQLTELMKDMQEYPGRYFTISVFGNSKRASKQDKQREDAKRKMN
ncbi:MAG: MlaD family protein [Bacteroidota bacterium]